MVGQWSLVLITVSIKMKFWLPLHTDMAVYPLTLNVSPVFEDPNHGQSIFVLQAYYSFRNFAFSSWIQATLDVKPSKTFIFGGSVSFDKWSVSDISHQVCYSCYAVIRARACYTSFRTMYVLPRIFLQRLTSHLQIVMTRYCLVSILCRGQVDRLRTWCSTSVL
jgi:hypothetical protein